GAPAERRDPRLRQDARGGLAPLPAAHRREQGGEQGRAAGLPQEAEDGRHGHRRRIARRRPPQGRPDSTQELSRAGKQLLQHPRRLFSRRAQATKGGIGGTSTCCVFTSRTPRTARATSTASSMAAVPSRVTSPLLASTVMRYFRVSGLVASATWVREASARSVTDCWASGGVASAGRGRAAAP